MPIQFPTNPEVNQEYTYEGKVWQWDGSAWVGVRQETGIQRSNIWSKQNLLIPKRGFGLNSGYNGTTDQRRTAAGTIPMLKHYMERDLNEFINNIGFIGLLDLYPSAAAAYSVRALRAAYTGSAIRVRRASDNAEQDIGFTLFGDLDTTALTSFCSGTNGFVTTWYDQSENGRNVIQPTAANQPQIVSGGTVLTENGKPCVNFTGIDKRLKTIDNSLFFNDCTISYVCRSISTATFAPLTFGYGNHPISSKSRYLGPLNNNLSFVVFGSDYVSTISAAGDSTINLYSANYIMSTNVATVYKNASTQSGIPGTQATTTTNAKFAINEIADRNESATINFSEGVFYAFNNNSNLTGIRSNQNTYYAIY